MRALSASGKVLGTSKAGPADERVTHRQLRTTLLGGGVLVALSSATTLALASGRIVAEQAAFRAPAAARCVPSTLNRSAVLPGTSLAVSPLPGSYDASRARRSACWERPQGAPSGVSVSGSQTGSHRGRLRGYSQGDGASFVPSSPFRARRDGDRAREGEGRLGDAAVRLSLRGRPAERDDLHAPRPPGTGRRR